MTPPSMLMVPLFCAALVAALLTPGALAQPAPPPNYRPGAYCYAYRDRLTYPTFPVTSSPRPVFAALFRRIRITRTSLAFRNRPYTLRCFFRLAALKSATPVRFELNARAAGRARLLRGGKPVLSVFSTAKSWQWSDATSASTLELQYTVISPAIIPAMTLTASSVSSGKAVDIETDLNAIVPVLVDATPRDVSVSGGTRITLLGYGLAGTTAEFGAKWRTARVNSLGMAIAPKTASAGFVQLTVRTRRGIRSNPVAFRYLPAARTCVDQVAFNAVPLKSPAPPTTLRFLRQPTSVAIGPDQRLYIGTLSGALNVLGYDPVSLQASSLCGSLDLKDQSLRKPDGTLSPRVVLGVAFNPREVGTGPIKPYVTTSTVNWWIGENVARSNKGAWRNGAVDRLVVFKDPGTFAIKQANQMPLCVRYDKRIVTGLPVANGGSHTVNALAFDQNGDLLIAVGGITNMGLPGVVLGNTWESPLSAAVVRARITTSPNFDGRITYIGNASAPHIAKLSQKTKQNFQVYAPGFRQLFAMTVTTDGSVYGVDQGPGCPLGGASIKCSDINARKPVWNLNAKTDWPSPVRGSHAGCNGWTREDKVVRIRQGKFYGHPNLNRGKGECTYIDPLTGKAPFGGKPPGNYQRQIDLVSASVTGLGQYSANHFCGELRGDLVLSTFQTGMTWRLRKTWNDRKLGRDALSLDGGGIAFVEDVAGNLVFVRFSKNDVVVLRPRISIPAGTTGAKARPDLRAVHPTRVRRTGGVTLSVGGFGLARAGAVWVGKAKCVVKAKAGNGRTLQCEMPSRAEAGCDVCAVRVVANGKPSVLTRAVAYMKM